MSLGLEARCELNVEGCEAGDEILVAVERIVHRHDALRSRLHTVPYWPYVVQRVARDPIGDSSEGEARELFVEHEGLGGRSHRVVLRAFSAVLDPRSFATIGQELAALLGGTALKPDPVQFTEFSDWRNEVVGDTAHGVDDALNPTRDNFSIHRVERELGPSLADALDRFAQDAGVRRGEVLLLAWMTYRWRLETERTCTVAVAEDGRKADPMLGDVVGAATAYLPVTASFDATLPFTAALDRVREAHRAATTAGERGLATSAPGVAAFDVAPPTQQYTAGDVTVRVCRADARTEPFRDRLTWMADMAGLAVELDTASGPAVAAERMLDGVLTLLSDAIARPAAALGDLELVSAEERAWLAQVARGRRRSVADTPVAQILAAATARPGQVAVRDSHAQLRYEELLDRAAGVAAALSAAGIGRGDHVVVLADRSCWSLVAIVGVMLVGAAYVPLDEGVPLGRLETMIDDCGARVVLARVPVHLPESVLCVDPAATKSGSSAPVARRTLDDTAYVLYTSGSTGRPKGVVISDRGLANYIAWAVDHYGLAGPGEAIVSSPFGFDLTVTTSVAPLTVGGTVVVAPNTSALDVLSVINPARGIAALKLTPRHLELLVSQLDGTAIGTEVRTLVIGGEPLNRGTVDRWRQLCSSCLVVNEYGPTETVVGSAFYDVPEDADTRPDVAIGRPIDNTTLHVLDNALRLVPCGTVGELFIGGVGVARGYLGASAQTAVRFLPNPFTGDGALMYRTGDLVRRDHDGDLTYVGRVDDQLKIRGLRVEPGEVEQVLMTVGGVRAAVVVPSGQALVAFVVRDGGSNGDEDLLDHAATRLPDYMVPARIVRVPELPLTPNGKVDRAHLVRNVRPLPAAMRALETELERVVDEVWRRVLRLDDLGLDESFFEVGGESLSAIEVMQQLQQRLDRPLRVVALFEHPTVRRLAAHMSGPDDGGAAQAGAARAAKRVSARARTQRRRRQP